MPITTPPSINALPAAPDPNDRSTFNSLAYPWSSSLTPFSNEMSAVAANVYANALEAETNATTSAAAAESAAGSSNYVGSWASLSGALTTPASVSYNDAVWILAADIADVTAHVPGVSAQWIRVTAEPVPASAMVLLATMTPTAAANLDLLSVFTSDYDNYLVTMQGLRPNTDSNSLRMNYAASGVADSSSFYTYFSPSDGSTQATTFTGYLGLSHFVLAAGVGMSGNFTVCNANSASSIKSGLGTTSFQKTASPGVSLVQAGHAYHAANAITGFRLYWSSGANFQASGIVRVYGYANT